MSKLISKYKAVFVGSLEIYDDKVEIKKFFGLISKSIPLQRIANLNLNRLTSTLTIETTGGEKTQVTPWGGGSTKEAKEKIEELLNKHSQSKGR